MSTVFALETHSTRRDAAQVEIVIPVYNEEAGLAASVRRLHEYLHDRFPLSWIVTIADNASTDRTWGIACRLSRELDGVQAMRLDQKGRGRALRTAWTASSAPVVAYMDVDLSTDLDALLPLVAPLLSGHSDMAIGSRLAPGARVVRGPKREAISRCYNLILKATLRSGFSDAQCGFKAIRTDVARELLPIVEDQGWFFDTELLVLAEHNGLRIHEVPVDWVDDPDSRVNVVGTAKADLHGVWRMLRSTVSGRASVSSARTLRDDGAYTADLASQLVRFASIGIVSTMVFALLFLLLVGPLGALLADVVALGVCTLANTAANRRLTFATRGRAGRARHYLAGLALAGLPLVLTLGTLLVLAAAGVTSVGAQLLALTGANLVAAVGRFILLRRWVFGSSPSAPPSGMPPVPPATDRRPGDQVTWPERVDRDEHDADRDGDGHSHHGPGEHEPARDEPIADPRASNSDPARTDPGRAPTTIGHRAPRAWRARLAQLLKYGMVSIIATTVSLTVLGTLVATDAMPAAWANVVATAVGIVPSFELNRRWVWNKRGKRSVVAEIGPFCVLSFAGLGLSTLAVALTAQWASNAGLDTAWRTIAVQLANLAAFGSLWVLQFVLLDRVLFGRTRGRDAGPSDGPSTGPTTAAPPRVRTLEAA